MVFNLSLTQLVIIIISVFAIILGTVYLIQVATFSEETINSDFPTPYSDSFDSSQSRFQVFVTPSSSQEGTVFALIASVWPPRDGQDISLTIERDGQAREITLFDDGQHQDDKADDNVYGALLDSTDFPLGTYEIKNLEGESVSEFTIQDSECLPLFGSPAYEKINFLFLPSGYADLEDFKRDADKIILGADTLSEIEPFRSNFDDFSFSYLAPTADLQCTVGCKGVESMVCCNDTLITDASSQCHNDGIIVLLNSDEGCGTASFYTKVCAKSSRAGQILTHELGHAFGGLADEYVYTDYFESYSLPDKLIRSMPNCDVAGCPKWANQTASCYEGCTSPNLYRSSENSLMRYVSYGKFNEVSRFALQKNVDAHIAKELELHKQNPAWRSYYVNLNYKNGEVSLSPASLMPVKSGVSSVEGPLTAVLRDERNRVIYSSKISLPFLEFPALEISDRPLLLEDVTVPIILPFNAQAKSLEISEDGKLLTVLSLSSFSDVCGDNVCQNSENRINCAADCTSEKDNFCESGACDPDCPNFEECNSVSNNNLIWPILLIIIPITLIFIIIAKARKN